MCGIAGRYHFKSRNPVDRRDLERMNARMAHRGPDGEGYYVDGPLGFAHKRLSIIDLEGGRQPMLDDDLVIVFNGEIFNYLELFDELRPFGLVPKTKSDTEAILLAYRKWGLDFPSRLNGMFAIALWDKSKKRLVMARDRMGVKPLYYAITDDGIAFASELKALRGGPGIDTSLDHEAFDDFMTLGYVVNPRCVVKGVQKLEPGTMMTFDERGLTRSRYWQLRFSPDESKSENEWADEVRALFDDAVKLRLRSDVPFGVLLSGGVDSTAIASTLVRQLGKAGEGIDSFCTGIDVPGAVNEFEWARKTAKRLGTRHHELVLSAKENGDLLVESAGLLDEPLAEPMVAQLLGLCRFVRRYVTVVLSGEGADETWFGYTAYRTQYAIELMQRAMGTRAIERMKPFVDLAASRLPLPNKVKKHLRNAMEPLERRYLGLNQFDTVLKERIYSPMMREVASRRDARESMRRLYDDGVGGSEAISRMASVDCRAWLVDNTLLRSDLMSMAASVELRVPFMDYRLVELATRIPARFKVKPHTQKAILKKALADRLPEDVVKRKKVGFPTPLIALFRGPWGREAEEAVMNPTTSSRGLFDLEFVRTMFEEHREGRANYAMPLYQLVMFEHWARAADAASAR